jgi:hypothetical protein
MASRPIDSTLHGVADYSTGALLQVLPKALDIEGSGAAKVLRGAGALHGGYSLFTDYPLGVVKAIPFKVHLGLDTAWALALGAAPFVSGEWKKGRRHWLPHVLLAAYELGALAMTELDDTNTGAEPGGGVKRPVAEAPPAFPSGHPVEQTTPADGPRPLQPKGSQSPTVEWVPPGGGASA